MTTARANHTPKALAASPRVEAHAPHANAVMRKTQAFIGLVLLAGVAAAYYVSTAWILLPGVIGLGLLFAGTSGMCPMASLIARLPWNASTEAEHRAPSSSCCGDRCV